MKGVCGGRFFCLVLLLFTMFSACGKKTQPVPPDTVLPAPITDLVARLDEKGVELSWSYPTKTVMGSRLPYQIDGFLLERSVLPLEDECAGCPVPFGKPIEIDAEIGRSRGEYREPLLRSGHRYVYRVRTKAGWQVQSGVSNSVTVVWDTPTAPPEGLWIETGDRILTLHWQPPAGLLDGTPIADPLRYQIFRSTDGVSFSPISEVTGGLSYEDKGLRNGGLYHYRVRAIRLHHGVEAAGASTAPLAASPRDLSPPASPGQLTLVAEKGGIRILWASVNDPDLGGFKVYRRSARGTRPELIGEVGPTALSFLDARPPVGQKIWYYAVSAFDRASPVNESFASTEVAYEPVR